MSDDFYLPVPSAVQAQILEPVPGLNPGDLVELGAFGKDLGMTTLEARGMTAELQQIAVQATMGGALKILERVRKIQLAQRDEILTRLQMRAGPLGLISVSTAQAIVSGVLSRAPQS